MGLPVGVEISDLKDISVKAIGFRGAIEALLDNKVIVVKGYENTRHSDILVKLAEKGLPVTRIAFNVGRQETGEWFQPFWSVYDLPMNALVTQDCYLYTEDWGNYDPAFLIDDIVYYKDEHGVQDSAIVTKVLTYKDPEDPQVDRYAYELSKVDHVLAQEELKGL